MGRVSIHPLGTLAGLVAFFMFCSLAFAQEPAKKLTKRSAELPTLIVFDLVPPKKGVEKSHVNILTEVIIDRVAKTKRYQVIGQKDLDKLRPGMSVEPTVRLD